MNAVTPDRACPTCGQFGRPLDTLGIEIPGPPIYECSTCLELWEIVK